MFKARLIIRRMCLPFEWVAIAIQSCQSNALTDWAADSTDLFHVDFFFSHSQLVSDKDLAQSLWMIQLEN